MRKIILTIGILLNVFILIFAFATSFSSTVIVIFCVSAIMIVYGIFLNNRKMVKIFSCSLVIGFILFIGFNVFIYNYGKTDNITYNEDALIVLGAGVNGEIPSLILSERLNVALKYYKNNPDAIIIVSGGQGPREDITEALAMEKYLVKGGIPQEKIIKEQKSTSTIENFAFSKLTLDEHFNKPYKCAIVTNDFHIFRSMMIASKMGLDGTHIHAKIPKYTMPANYLRETIAILIQVVGSL